MPSVGTRLGGSAFNHGPSSNAEQEYDRLRDLARKEQDKYHDCARRSQAAYQRGDGEEAHNISQEGKRHASAADVYNKQASEYIFRENNAVGKVQGDTIDLHGQYVEEAEEILEQRIRYAQQTNQSHLHVIVGKGNHSTDHIQKIKPRVEQVCRELHLQYHTEENEGRMFIDLKGAGHAPGGYDYQQQHQPQHAEYGKPHYETAYPMGKTPQYGQAAGGYPGAQQQSPMQYGGQQQHHRPQQQMEHQEPEEKKESKCCGLCVVM
ncbi:uncharacterized protein LTR77_004787 [Saxophila tyrrhenica]|uniref:Smr domain-containing protein n=1 Tax=Saxophila tyrrhenica TaxID=1690608 RepID=A0AAV9PAI3_9PEZI|nr:hypothetical protein LTR77_004787 [Saxophila tyrrhenica]